MIKYTYMNLNWLRRQDAEPWILAVINLWALALAEWLGPEFSRVGYTSLFNALFLLLVAARLAKHYHVYDPSMRLMLRVTLAALTVLAAVHGFMFALWLCDTPYSAAYMVNNANYILASWLIIVIGAEAALRDYTKLPASVLWVPTGLVFLLLAASVTFLTEPRMIDLSPDKPMPYIYLGVIILTGIFATLEIGRIGRMIPAMKDFSRFLVAALVAFSFQAVVGLFRPATCLLSGWTDHLPVAAFLASNVGLSCLILAFGRPMKLTGVYADIQEQAAAEQK